MSLKKQDLSRWYESIVCSSGVASAGLVKGTLFIHPRGWSIWENIQKFIDFEFDKLGVQRVCFPSLIPSSEMEKEKSELNGFVPELYEVRRSSFESEEKKTIFLRPTSEILFSSFFRRILSSHEQLPILLNQWCNVFRAEKNTKAFLRGCEFNWQELHSLHKTKEDALNYLEKIHDIYGTLLKDVLNISVLKGEKTVDERFKGSLKTLTYEAVMPDGQTLQIATTHYLGQNFSHMFDIKYSNENNVQQNPHQLSAGSSTRLIGALILVHGDDQGLVLPFKLALIQIKILVIDGAIDRDSEVYLKLNKALSKYRTSWDFSPKSFGYKIKDSEISGTPFAIVIGKQELEKNQILVKSRAASEKNFIFLDEVEAFMEKEIVNYSDNLFMKSEKYLQDSIVEVNTLEEAKKEILENKKIVLVPWFDDEENELKFKSEKLGFGPRCIKERCRLDRSCFYSGKKANVLAYFARSY